MEATVTERVIHSVAKSTNTDVLELPPLYEAIDPDALETLVESMSSGRIEFTFLEQEVTVYSDGTISLSERPSWDSTQGVTVNND